MDSDKRTKWLRVYWESRSTNRSRTPRRNNAWTFVCYRTSKRKRWFYAYFLSEDHRFLWWSRDCRRAIPVGAGLAFRDKYFETGGVTMTYFGGWKPSSSRINFPTKLLTWS
jgi:hypothetical protein